MSSPLVSRSVRPGDPVLDPGIGTGLLASHGAALAQAWVGLDYSGAMLARAAAKMARLRALSHGGLGR